MTVYKRTQITVETDQVLIIRRRGCVRQWCRDCGRETDMVGLCQAGLVAGVAQTLLLEYARTERWHLTEAVAGTPLVCLDSLLQAAGAGTDLTAVKEEERSRKEKDK